MKVSKFKQMQEYLTEEIKKLEDEKKMEECSKVLGVKRDTIKFIVREPD